MIRLPTFGALALYAGLTIAAHAELTMCNRTSYRMEAALAVGKLANVETRGWFRLDPGECRQVLRETLDGETIYVHARTPAVYGNAPSPQGGDADFCIRKQDFHLTNARSCPATEQVRFSAANPLESSRGHAINLAEEADYDDAQARLAGIQRLLIVAGYDAYPIDGVAGARTQAAISKFLKDRKLPADALAAPEFFDRLIEAAGNPQGPGFSWCNDTKYAVMASIGVVQMGVIVTRGWYRVEAGHCLRPDLNGEPHRLYSYAEAVDMDGRTIKRGDGPLAWGGTVRLCTRDSRFEVADHKDCASRGLNANGFAVLDIGARPDMVVRFKER